MHCGLVLGARTFALKRGVASEPPGWTPPKGNHDWTPKTTGVQLEGNQWNLATKPGGALQTSRR